MVSDASEAISFICNNVVSFGGDPNKIYLMGQSAGAHIAACALLEQAIKESKGENTYWNVAQIKAYFGLSGGYNIQNLVDHFHECGLYCSIFLSIMEGEESLPHYSPESSGANFSSIVQVTEENLATLFINCGQVTQADLKLFFESICGELKVCRNGTIKIDLETNKIMDFIKFDVGNVVMVTSGRNTGRVGVIKNREKHKGSFETIHVLLGAFCYVQFSPICCTGKHRMEFKFGGRKSVET
ncbi:putative isoprenylcysteine alpha-carbonyl methylesterase ICME [Zea mays]|uniref:protein-S-isoprenylcysteine alpha-carbonyl methylesterase n=1 Tax=Zea mays TaxID=4577 RepID=A0A3L6F4C6_MAIZE|nr:putative isoprenylcysteine alpha-carbonyl methylesterase ICME [Zea mays]